MMMWWAPNNQLFPLRQPQESVGNHQKARWEQFRKPPSSFQASLYWGHSISLSVHPQLANILKGKTLLDLTILETDSHGSLIQTVNNIDRHHISGPAKCSFLGSQPFYNNSKGWKSRHHSHRHWFVSSASPWQCHTICSFSSFRWCST